MVLTLEWGGKNSSVVSGIYVWLLSWFSTAWDVTGPFTFIAVLQSWTKFVLDNDAQQKSLFSIFTLQTLIFALLSTAIILVPHYPMGPIGPSWCLPLHHVVLLCSILLLFWWLKRPTAKKTRAHAAREPEKENIFVYRLDWHSPG